MALPRLIGLENAHSAVADAEATGKLLLAMVANGMIPDDVDRAISQLSTGSQHPRSTPAWPQARLCSPSDTPENTDASQQTWPVDGSSDLEALLGTASFHYDASTANGYQLGSGKHVLTWRDRSAHGYHARAAVRSATSKKLMLLGNASPTGDMALPVHIALPVAAAVLPQ